jgi:hypothetical protein
MSGPISGPAGDGDLSCARCARPVRWGNRTPPAAGIQAGSGRRVAAARRWPEGYVCSGCFVKACETYGACVRCGADRLVPGLDTSGGRLCADCAGLGEFTCTRCGEEAWRQEAGVCARCVLRDRLTSLLDAGDGMRPELVPFAEHLLRMSRPRSGLLWLSKPHVPPILQALARGEVALTHQGLSQLTPWRSVIHVRDLLVAAGVLPPVDRFLFLFEQWLPGWLASIDQDEQHNLLTRYATWQILRKLREVAGNGPIGSYRNNTRPVPAAHRRRVPSCAFCPRGERGRVHPDRPRHLDRQLATHLPRAAALPALVYHQPSDAAPGPAALTPLAQAPDRSAATPEPHPPRPHRPSHARHRPRPGAARPAVRATAAAHRPPARG